MIQSVLVANRGEIARRVFRTCRELGIATVAVYADPDADAPHVQEADAAVRLPGSAPTETYLRGDLIVKAALAAGADAVHPGYGFLSENAGFARAVLDAGLSWIGPSPDAIEAMASKTRAKELMREAGVPLLAPVDPDAATEADLPLLVKAAAGGGGRGMRAVRELHALPGELEAASAEAASAFGDGSVFAEPYVERGRHVEVQILADRHGTVWVLGTRDCSLQRRHQKVIEEAPAPGLDDALRRTLHESAAEAARAIGYTGAGTVEFLVSAAGRPYFLEMNTRLQVEHPVTEEVFGLDLVALQIRVAEGGRLADAPPEPSGHAIEARLYAEDPARGWQPQTGVLHLFAVGQPAGGDGGLRVDSGYADGGEIGVHYDPMIAKVVARAPKRAEAVRTLARALERARVHGPVTNRDLLVRALRHPQFGEVRFDTGWLERNLSELTGYGSDPSAPGPSAVRLSALAAALADAATRSRGEARDGGPAGTVASRLGGWRNVPSRPQTKRYRGEPDGSEHEVRYRLTREGLTADDCPGVRLLATAPDRVVLEVDGVRREFGVACYGTRVHVDSALGAFAFTALSRFPEPTARTEPGSLLAPMPGTVIRVAEVAVGGTVAAGQPLLWLEAMKMEHKVSAPTAGTLTELHAVAGRQVEVGALLAVVTETADDAPEADGT
ncbi:biotin carboxylase N-terminal domain-containing protein [Streptomyces sp. NPDC051776]|uniref:acetyl/propionyl/methylcrotonyl-CoA carboxylase subunit alpha n=1 Tax=Streptomyces sp. NPDC051776 TaxID=3155414 RepID=UPI0034266C60